MKTFWQFMESTSHEEEIKGLCDEIADKISLPMHDKIGGKINISNDDILNPVREKYMNVVEIMFKVGNDIKAEILEGLFNNLMSNDKSVWDWHYLNIAMLTGKRGFVTISDSYSMFDEPPHSDDWTKDPCFHLVVNKGILSTLPDEKFWFEMRILNSVEIALDHQMGLTQFYHGKKVLGKDIFWTDKLYIDRGSSGVGYKPPLSSNDEDGLVAIRKELEAKMGKGVLPAGFEILGDKNGIPNVQNDYEVYKLVRELHKKVVKAEAL